MIQSCKNCRYGHRESIILDENKPPKLVVVCKLIPPLPSVEGATLMHRRPLLELDNWCGQFRLSLRKLLSRSDG